MADKNQINESPLTEEQRKKLQECVRAGHELRDKDGFIHCLTDDIVIGPSK